MNSVNISHAGMIFSGLLYSSVSLRGICEWLVGKIATRIFAARDGKNVIGDSHFNVIGFTANVVMEPFCDFPSKAADGAVIGDHVGMAADS